MAARAFAEPAVAVVTAKTLPEARPSTRVLERAGFRRTGCADDPGAGPVWVWSLPRP
jgi:RimJ/RimL family protein N-acetyltransferase